VAGSSDWRVHKGGSVLPYSDRLVVQGRRAGLLDLSICLAADREAAPGGLGLLRPVVAASTSEGIRRDTGIVSWLHWPNLVTIDGRVVAKTSLSLAPRPGAGGEARIVARILVNCFAARSDRFSSIALPSTSISKTLGVEIDLDLLRDKVLHALNWYHAEWERGMIQKLVERIRPTIFWLGGVVEVKLVDGLLLKGRARGLDDEGSLLLEQEHRGGRLTSLKIRPENVNLVRAVTDVRRP
jgi:biotin-(acetyl-CoA carboxylase) ligase